MWWQFRRHRLAMASAVVLLLIFLVAAFCEFVAPFDPLDFTPRYTYAPPQAVHLFDRDETGSLVLRPYVNGFKVTIDKAALRRIFVVDPTVKIPIGFFVKTEPYKMWGIFTLNHKLVGPLDQSNPMYLLGADRLGRDLFSRTVYGTRISMSIGLIGVALSLFLGIVLGGISGYYGGRVDHVIQRVIEFILSLPTTPLWLGLAAALPSEWPPLRIYLCITIILSLYGWTNLARVVRGRFLSLRTEDFVTAARLDGASEPRSIFRQMAPSFVSHIIAEVSLAIPNMILAETALSFLGLKGLAAAHHQLGRAAAGGAEHPLHRHGALALRPGHRRGHRRAGAELRGRRAARCRRPLQPPLRGDEPARPRQARFSDMLREEPRAPGSRPASAPSRRWSRRASA